MVCDFCGCEPADPLTLRPVHGLLYDEADQPVKIDPQEQVACEDCYAEAFEPERQFRLKHECPVCWMIDCECQLQGSDTRDREGS